MGTLTWEDKARALHSEMYTNKVQWAEHALRVFKFAIEDSFQCKFEELPEDVRTVALDIASKTDFCVQNLQAHCYIPLQSIRNVFGEDALKDIIVGDSSVLSLRRWNKQIKTFPSAFYTKYSGLFKQICSIRFDLEVEKYNPRKKYTSKNRKYVRKPKE